MGVATASGDASELIAAVRDYWVILRDFGLADANPVKILADATDVGCVAWVFRWKSPEARVRAASEEECVAAAQRIAGASESVARLPFAHEVYQGFEYRRFPQRGGVELLRGKCTCTVKLDMLDAEFELDGQNGFVIMHRGPGYEQGGIRIMPVTIYQHGADSPNPLEHVAELRDAPVEMRTAPLRVEQNTDLPQFGIIRALQPGADFPAVAMWVVHWRVQTPIGTLVTDPAQPLVFGPTVVQHYPPVGTEFFSAVGPVAVYREPDGERVGTLTPGQLTAFDIVVTMDDEIPSLHDRPARYHVDMFNRYVGDAKLRLSTDELVDDHRVPENPAFGQPPKPARRTTAKATRKKS
ncbi:MAG TPA: hypothetical protein VF230_13225 [Acidimicrobiales bacterium]